MRIRVVSDGAAVRQGVAGLDGALREVCDAVVPRIVALQQAMPVDRHAAVGEGGIVIRRVVVHRHLRRRGQVWGPCACAVNMPSVGKGIAWLGDTCAERLLHRHNPQGVRRPFARMRKHTFIQIEPPLTSSRCPCCTRMVGGLELAIRSEVVLLEAPGAALRHEMCPSYLFDGLRGCCWPPFAMALAACIRTTHTEAVDANTSWSSDISFRSRHALAVVSEQMQHSFLMNIRACRQSAETLQYQSASADE